MNPVRIIARSALASMFITGGLDVIRHPEPRAELAAPVLKQARGVVPGLPDDDIKLVRINGAVHLLAGTSMALGKFPRLSALVLAGSLLPTTVGGHRFWEQDDAMMKKNQQAHFMKNLGLFGGLLFASMDRKGKPSLGYRAEKSAAKAKKEAKRQTKNAKSALSVG